MSIQSISNLSTELFIRNKESEYMAMNKTAAAPQLGVFWIKETNNSFELIGESVSLRDGELLNGIKVNPDNHYNLWSKIQKQNPEWLNKNYMSVPRGRISYIHDLDHPTFLIFLPSIYKGNGKLENTVLSTYNIPKGVAVFEYDDPHYKVR